MKKHISRTSAKALILMVFTIFAFTSNIKAQSADEGAKIFKQNCAVCHASHSDQMGTGPGLKGLFDRIPKGDWINKWVINNEALIKAGDPYAKQIKAKYGAAMTVFEGQIDEKGVASIVAFLKAPLKDPGGNIASTTTTGGGPVEEQKGGIEIYT